MPKIKISTIWFVLLELALFNDSGEAHLAFGNKLDLKVAEFKIVKFHLYY